MQQPAIETRMLTWNAPECPFVIEYAAHVLDEIRVAVVDAFFSIPRGGAEIGGILLGKAGDGRVQILGYAPVECEHAHGPSFTLSPRDEQKLRDLLAEVPVRFPDLDVVGWYHSHTRSEIFLSEADLDIHKRYFPDPKQVALVLRPHAFQPTQAGFFFREHGGKIHAVSSYAEFVVDTAEQSAPAIPDFVEKQPSTPEREDTVPPAATLTPVEAAASEAPDRAADDTAVSLPAPRFLTVVQEGPARWAVVLLGLAAAGAVAACGYQTRDVWLPRLTAAARPARAPETAATAGPVVRPVGLNTVDKDGQLQIYWNPEAPSVRRALGAILEISEGGPHPRPIALDAANLQNGFFTYARQSERVDLRLILRQPDGPEVREETSFFGRLPVRNVEKELEIQRQRDELAAKSQKLQSDLNAQTEHVKKLERELKGVKDELRNQQQRRLVNQLPDGRQ